MSYPTRLANAFGGFSHAVCPLVMWLGVKRDQFIKPAKKIDTANADGACV